MLYKYVYALKDLRNAIAHNDVVYDTRFKKMDPSRPMKQCLILEMGMPYINFKTIGDYIILICYYLKLLKVSKTEIKSFIRELESVSFVSNTAGVYGAFLKKWDDRALKDIIFLDVSDGVVSNNPIIKTTGKIEDIIEDVPCDILYLDPPYTQNQYGTQYHLLETLVLNDKPEFVSKVTGSRSTREMRSDWSKIYKVHILFDKILAKTTAQHIFLSYNNDGDMSKYYIEAIMKRYAVDGTFECITMCNCCY